MAILEKATFNNIRIACQGEGLSKAELHVETNEFEMHQDFKVSNLMLVADVSEDIRTTLFLAHDKTWTKEDQVFIGIGKKINGDWTYPSTDICFTPFYVSEYLGIGILAFMGATASLEIAIQYGNAANPKSIVEGVIAKVQTQAGFPDLDF